MLVNLDISSLTMGILRPRCIVSLVIYQGASIKDLRVFDWNRWRISMLELLAVPHSWIIGLKGRYANEEELLVKTSKSRCSNLFLGMFGICEFFIVRRRLD